jgi:hypothetical protein
MPQTSILGLLFEKAQFIECHDAEVSKVHEVRKFVSLGKALPTRT